MSAIAENFSSAQLASVQHVATDSTSEKLFGFCVSELTIHDAGSYSPGHRLRVRLWSKKTFWFETLVPYAPEVRCSGWKFTARPLNAQEIKHRAMILDFSISDGEIGRILDHLQEDAPFRNRLEFL